MKLTIAWIATIVFAALTFVFFFQEGHAIGLNTWFFEHQRVLTISSLVLTFISIYFVRKNTN